MAERATWDVTPAENSWEVKKRGNNRASATEETKSDAVSRAKEIARGNEPSQVVVRRSDGTIQESITYD
jgi:uncharacterized protein YdaT